MSGIYALCDAPEAAERAVDQLLAAGVQEEDITVFSSQPFEQYRFGQKDSETSIQWVAVLGGVAGFVATVSIIALVQLAWPLRTGGMPFTPFLPNLIPIFEMTMLGAVLSTIVALCVTARLPSRLPNLYDPAVSDGKILIGVAAPAAAQLEDIEQALEGNGEVKRVE